MNGRKIPPTGAELHRLWLELVDADGPFLAVPALKRVWPQGMPQPTGRGARRRQGRQARVREGLGPVGQQPRRQGRSLRTTGRHATPGWT